MRSGVFPSELKLARVVPIFKAGDSSALSNYRPISVLTFFAKVFEKIVYNKILDNKLLCYEPGNLTVHPPPPKKNYSAKFDLFLAYFSES